MTCVGCDADTLPGCGVTCETCYDRFIKVQAGTWPAFKDPQPPPSRAVFVVSRVGGSWRWHLRMGSYRAVGYESSLLRATGAAFDAMKAVTL